jgi:hypothetical protein
MDISGADLFCAYNSSVAVGAAPREGVLSSTYNHKTKLTSINKHLSYLILDNNNKIGNKEGWLILNCL